jgi:hypothetical protein
MTVDEQEAESRKYADVAMVLRLNNGNFAFFGPNRKLYMIVSWPEEVLQSNTFWTWCAEQTREYKPARSPAIKATDIIDVGDIEI